MTSEQGGDAIFEVRGLTGGYEGSSVLRGVWLRVPRRSVVALLGPNGAGKTTLLRMGSGLLRPTAGSILLNGNDVTHASPSRRARLGLVHIFEGRGVFPSLTVRENLLMQAPPEMREPEIVERAADAFPVLADRRHQVAGTMSGGEQQMLALARTYLASPEVVLVDEASLGLAPAVVDDIFQFLARLAAGGAALLVVEQYVNRALDLASSVYVLGQGEIVHHGGVADVDEDRIFAMYSGTSAPLETQPT